MCSVQKQNKEIPNLKKPECFWSQLTVYDSENFEVRNEPSTLHVVNIKTLMAFIKDDLACMSLD